MNSTKILNWGIIGTGNIAHQFAEGLKYSEYGRLAAVGSRTFLNAEGFGLQYGIEPDHCFGTYHELLQCSRVNIVYISTPHPQHFDIAIAAAKAHKNLLIEKPMAMTEKQVQMILDITHQHNVFVMEAYMYRCHPLTIKLLELINTGVIGDIKKISASFSFDGRSLGKESRLWRNELGGGALMDIGGYPLSFCRLVAGVVDSDEMVEIKAVGHIQPDTKVDEWTKACIQFKGGIAAELYVSISTEGDCSVKVIGSKGELRVAHLWRPDIPPSDTVEIEHIQNGTHRIPIPLKTVNIYTIEADAVAHAILDGKQRIV
ncbi:hypothetical protein BDB01DRAFT_832381 [Pilobolus umbonatus]|nr:hypothetical protein BDB01DRAFT_832381 [Pilobolus umbonatus]